MLANFLLHMSSHMISRRHMASRKRAHNRNNLQRFGEWLRSLREAKNVPLRVVAAAAEMDQAHLSKAEARPADADF